MTFACKSGRDLVTMALILPNTAQLKISEGAVATRFLVLVDLISKKTSNLGTESVSMAGLRTQFCSK